MSAAVAKTYGSVRPAFEARLAHGRVLHFPDRHVGGEDDLHDLLEPSPRRKEDILDDETRERILGLAPQERGALEMRVIDGWSYQRIGEALGMTRQGAYRAYVRAVARVRGEDA